MMRFNLRDIVTGLAIAGLMLPEGVAYAGIAGLPASCDAAVPDREAQPA